MKRQSVESIKNLSFLEKNKFFAQLSDICYLSEKNAVSMCKELNISKPKLISISEAECMIFLYKDDVVIAFRGTEKEYQDTIINLKISQINGVHSGYYQQAENLYPKISRFHQEKRTLWFCGHSAGGAIATVIAKKLPPKELYTYGSPRVGSYLWVKELDCVHHRFVNNNDLIPFLPSFGYFHHGTEHYINYEGRICYPSKWQRFMDKLKGHLRAISKFQTFDSLYDHYMTSYLKKITKM